MRFRSWGPLTRTFAVLVTLSVLAVGAVLLVDVLREDPVCAPGVEKRGPKKECTGVTDGAFSYADPLDEVTARIKAENDRIAGEPHATVAMMMPMTAEGEVERQQILREVQGAYLAQYRANHLSNSRAPAIRLVLANPGRDSAHWEPVAAQLAAMARSKQDNLRVVTGFNVSVLATQRTIERLTRVERIPVVGGPITADDLGNSRENPDAYPGLAKVVPDNSDQAAALAHFNADVPAERTLVVEDLRENDNYINTLRQAFAERTRGAPRAPEQFRSPKNVNSEGTTSNDFRQMVATLCSSPAEIVYFAGRPVQLRQFVNELGDRGCTDRTYTVVTGSGASTLASDRKLDWTALRRGVTLQYASVAHPDAWTADDAPKTGGSAEAFRRLSDLADQSDREPVGPIGPTDLTDSRTITAHDAVWTAVTAIRNTAVGGRAVPPLSAVGNAWLRMHGSGRVEGASGWICLDNHGNAYNKAVAVVRLNPADRSIDHVGLGWPAGRPPTPACTAPRDD